MKSQSQKPAHAARRKARRFTVQALYQWQMTGANLREIETQFRVDNDLRKTDSAYFHELLHEIHKCINELDGYFIPFLDRELKDLDQVELAILRIGTYELSKRVDVPYKVAINEGIELAKYFGATESHKYVNGVLDRVAQKLRVLEVKAEPKAAAEPDADKAPEAEVKSGSRKIQLKAKSKISYKQKSDQTDTKPTE